MSIYRKIQIIFVVVIFFVTAFFTSYFYLQKEQDIQNKEKRYVQMSFFMENLFQNPSLNIYDEELKHFFDESSFVLIESKEYIEDIFEKATVEFDDNTSYSHVSVLRVLGDFYLSIKHPEYTLLLKDMEVRGFVRQTALLYLVSLLFLVGLYMWLIRSLAPLKKLQKEIYKISKGDLTISLKSDKEDEIADVSNAFDVALRKIESLIDSRQLFLRSIMHELKTPIAKGKLLNEFLEDTKQKKSYDAIFERLQLLIEEFSKIEKMLTSSYTLKISKCNAIDIVEHALELMLMDKEEVARKVVIHKDSVCFLNVDFELLSLAVKNLIDNALKYSSNSKAEVYILKNSISISSTGKKFTDSLDIYMQPFEYKSSGLGLGLYIVQNILKLLDFKLDYTYKENKNILTIS